MMHWNSFSEFLAMGGYAGYVWGSFGVTALIMAVEPLLVAQRHKTLVARLRRLLRSAAAENAASRSHPASSRNSSHGSHT